MRLLAACERFPNNTAIVDTSTPDSPLRIHVWVTDSHGKPVDKLPLGTPHLAWSFNHDGEADPAMIQSRDSRMKVSTSDKRNKRADLSQYAHPQNGVNDLRKSFPNSDGAPAGVRDTKER
jgi:hypothetical protein